MSDSQTPTDPTDEQIKSRISALIPDEKTRERFIKLLTEPERPEGWGSQSYAPFYRPYFGEQIKKLADLQLDSHQDITYDYKVFCKPHIVDGCSVATLYNRVNQSIRYLLEKMDPEGKYRDWRNIVKIKRDDEHECIRISIIPEISKASRGGPQSEIPSPRLSDPIELRPRWKREFEEWSEDSSRTEPFVKLHLQLSPEAIEQFKNELAGDRTIECIVDSTSVRAIKINDI